MSAYRNYTIKCLYVIIDFFLIYLSIYFACLLRKANMPFEASIHNILIHRENPFVFVFMFWLVTTILFVNANGLYQTRREILEGYEIALVLKSVLSASLLVIVMIYALKIQDFPRSVLSIGTAFIISSLSLWRIFKRGFVEYIVVRGYNNFNALIIGAGRVGLALSEEIKKHPALGIKIIGYLDDYKENNKDNQDIKILGKISDFNSIAKREFVDKVFVTIHHQGDMILRLLEEARELGVSVRVVPQGFDLISSDLRKYNIGFIPILEYTDFTPLRKQFGKRLFDFILCFLGIIILSPAIMLIAILIKADSPGPVFYLSKRYGRNGRIFNMLKFRSMHIKAEEMIHKLRDKNEVDGPIFKMKNDPRITKFGKFLRKYSLDELPQIYNVLIGEMSLVGPRPLPIDQIEKEDLNQLKRLEVRPGITGLWQIRGRSDISFNRLVKWDIWYINNWSLWLDINILLQTVPVVLKCKGAY